MGACVRACVHARAVCMSAWWAHTVASAVLPSDKVARCSKLSASQRALCRARGCRRAHARLFWR
eukprot:5535064-Alexandrium_andersonii.AAC.1